MSGLHASVEREFNRIFKYDALCGKLSFMDSFFFAIKKLLKSYYGKNNLTSKYSNFFNIVNLSKSDKIILLVSPAIKSEACIDMCL